MNPVLIVGDETYIAKPIYRYFMGQWLKNGWKWRRKGEDRYDATA